MFSGWSSLAQCLLRPLQGLSKPTYRALIWYLSSASVVTAVVSSVVAIFWSSVEKAALSAIAPSSWQEILGFCIARFWGSGQAVLKANIMSGVSMFLVTALLFPLKEMMSASYERDKKLLPNRVWRELSLPEQGWQESKVLVGFLLCQGSLFWLGLLAHPWPMVANWLGFFVVIFSCSVDFLSPVYQRHGRRYSQILKVLFRKLPQSLLFGAIFAGPGLLVAQWVQGKPNWPLGFSVGLVFATNIVAVAWACLSGTYLASRWFVTTENVSRSAWPARSIAWLLLLILLVGNSWGYSQIGKSLLHKQGLLFCEYRLRWRDIDVDVGKLSALLDDEVKVSLTLPLAVKNPTDREVLIEHSKIELRIKQRVVATADLSPFVAPAQKSTVQNQNIALTVRRNELSDWRSLLQTDNFSATLYVQVSKYFWFPIDLLGERR